MIYQEIINDRIHQAPKPSTGNRRYDMMTNNSRMWTLLAVLVLSIALGASPAIAQPVIEEVQVVDSTGDPLGLPEFLLIFGTGFGTISPTDTPVIFLGTDTMNPLDIAVSQNLCSATPPPPLDPAAECVVAELPLVTPCGDYLLSIQGPLPSGSCEVDGKPKALVFEYTGEDCTATTNDQGGQVTCGGDPMGEEPVQVACGSPQRNIRIRYSRPRLRCSYFGWSCLRGG